MCIQKQGKGFRGHTFAGQREWARSKDGREGHSWGGHTQIHAVGKHLRGSFGEVSVLLKSMRILITGASFEDGINKEDSSYIK